jgi:hypothetical protein
LLFCLEKCHWKPDGVTTEAEAPEARLRVHRAVAVLERADSRAARQLLEALAKGAPEAPRTRQAREALRRLGNRFLGVKMAPSLDRLRIRYRGGSLGHDLLISPRDREGFLRHLSEAVAARRAPAEAC